MRRSYASYKDWEDYKMGQYAVLPVNEINVAAAANILSSGQSCFDSMRRVIHEWPISCEQQLMETSQNRRAWLGQAACCLQAGVHDAATKAAWWTLTETQQNTANAIADVIILEWELNRRNAIPLFRNESSYA